jgi:hypothetical protein
MIDTIHFLSGFPGQKSDRSHSRGRETNSPASWAISSLLTLSITEGLTSHWIHRSNERRTLTHLASALSPMVPLGLFRSRNFNELNLLT